MSAVGFEPTRSKTLRPERNPLDHSGKLTLQVTQHPRFFNPLDILNTQTNTTTQHLQNTNTLHTTSTHTQNTQTCTKNGAKRTCRATKPQPSQRANNAKAYLRTASHANSRPTRLVPELATSTRCQHCNTSKMTATPKQTIMHRHDRLLVVSQRGEPSIH
jgi:hypothetical protein